MKTSPFTTEELKVLFELNFDSINTTSGKKMAFDNGYDEVLVYKEDEDTYIYDYTNRDFESEVKEYETFAGLVKKLKGKK